MFESDLVYLHLVIFVCVVLAACFDGPVLIFGISESWRQAKSLSVNDAAEK